MLRLMRRLRRVAMKLIVGCAYYVRIPDWGPKTPKVAEEQPNVDENDQQRR